MINTNSMGCGQSFLWGLGFPMWIFITSCVTFIKLHKHFENVYSSKNEAINTLPTSKVCYKCEMK